MMDKVAEWRLDVLDRRIAHQSGPFQSLKRVVHFSLAA